MLLLGSKRRRTHCRRQLVVAAYDVTVDDAVLVAGHESTVAGGARKALDVVDGGRLTASARPQHHLARWYVLTTPSARTRRAKHPADNQRCFS